MTILDPRMTWSPREYDRAYSYWLQQQQSHWLHCVGPNERVFTSAGLRTVAELHASQEPLLLWNGDTWVHSTPMIKTAHRDLYVLRTKEGYTHTITNDHRVMTVTGWKEAKDLVPGERLVINTQDVWTGQEHDADLAFLIGHFQGDGTSSDSQTIFSLWEHEYDLIPYIENAVRSVYDKLGLKTERYDYPTFGPPQKAGFRRLASMKLKQTGLFVKGQIPEFIWKSDKDTVFAYLKGLFYTDGTTYQGRKHESIKFGQTGEAFVAEIQLLLLALGIKSTRYVREPAQHDLPDGQGGSASYSTQRFFVLEVTQGQAVERLDNGIQLFAHRGRVRRGLKSETKSHPIVTARFESLTFQGPSDVYCVSVHNDHKAWVCNGFVTHNTEILMAGDVSDWKSVLSETEKHVIGTTLKGFVQAEVVIGDYWTTKIQHWFPKPEIAMMAMTFGAMESIHAVSYAYLNESLGLDDFDAFLQEPSAKAKIDRLLETKGKSRHDIARALAIFSAFNEGVNLFSSFAILLNFSRHNKMKGLGQIIAFSIKDESLHSEAGCWLFRTMMSEFPALWTDELKKEIYDAARLTIELEDNFLEQAFSKGPIEGLELKDVKAFIRHRANTKLQDLGLKSNWKNIDKEALDRMDWFNVLSAGVGHVDFFAQRADSYSKGVTIFTDAVFDDQEQA